MSFVRKSFIVAFMVASALALPRASVTSAAPAAAGVPGGPFATAFRVQNLASTPATCSYQVYNDAGGTSAAFTASLPVINPNDSAYVYTPSVSGFPAGTFGGVISCDQQVAVVVNFSDPTKGDVYVGTANPANTLYIPSAYNNYYNFYTTIRIQNAGTSSQTVNVEYYAPGASSPTVTVPVSLQANGAATVDQAGVAGLQQNVSYSARLVGSAPLAATVSIYGGTGTSVQSQLYAYSGFAGGATTTYQPVIMRNYYGYNTATTIQNLGSSAAQVKLTYSNGANTTYTIQPKSSQVVLDYQNPALSGTNVLYSSKVESLNGQPLIVTVNESTPATNRATTYEGMTSGSQNLVAPIVMRRYYKYNTSVTCQNLGASATNIRITYSGTSISNKTVVTGLQPNQTALIYQPAESQLPDGYLGSATLNADQNIVCVVNEDQNEAPQNTQVMDQLYGYDAIAKP